MDSTHPISSPQILTFKELTSRLESADFVEFILTSELPCFHPDNSVLQFIDQNGQVYQAEVYYDTQTNTIESPRKELTSFSFQGQDLTSWMNEFADAIKEKLKAYQNLSQLNSPLTKEKFRIDVEMAARETLGPDNELILIGKINKPKFKNLINFDIQGDLNINF